VLTPAYIEGSTLPNRQQHADDLRRMKGIPTAGDRQAQKENEQKAAQQAAQAQELQARGAMAQVAKAEAEADKTAAGADKERAQTQLLLAQAEREVLTPIEQPQMQQGPTEDELIEEALAAAG
jgi:hypothetical protein